MADEKQFRVRIVTEADLTGTRAAIDAQKGLNAELQKTKTIEADTNGPGTQELNASKSRIDGLFAKFNADKNADKNGGDVAAEMKAVNVASKQAAEGIGATALALGGYVTLAASAAAVVRALWERNEELTTSFGNAKEAALNFAADGLGAIMGRGQGLQSFFDAVTVALGGQTEAMKQALGPLDDYIARGERVKDVADQMADTIKSQKEATKEANQELAHQAKVSDADLQIEQRQLNEEMARRMKDVQDSGLSEEDKAVDIKTLQDEQAVREEEIRSRQALRETETRSQMQAVAEQQLVDSQGLVENADDRVNKAKQLSLAREGVAQAKAFGEQGRAGEDMAASADDFLGRLMGTGDAFSPVSSGLKLFKNVAGLSAEGADEQLQRAQQRLDDVKRTTPGDLSSLEAEQKAADLARESRQKAADSLRDVHQANTRANELGERADINQGMDADAAAARREQELQAKLQALQSAADRQAAGVIDGVSSLASHLVSTQSATNQALQNANAQLQGLSAETAAAQSGVGQLSNAERRSRRLSQRFYY